MQLFRPKYDVESCLDALRPVLESGWTGTGPKCNQMEKEWCEFTGAPFAHYVNSATAALHIALRMLDLPKGSKVLTTPLTFISTNAVILYEGLIPVFVDVNEDDLSMCSHDFLKKLHVHHAKAALWVHFGGHVSDHFMHVKSQVDFFKFPIIEDCAHAAGASYSDEKMVGGSQDAMSCFSFQAVKNLPTFDGGMICLPNEELYKRAKRLAWLGIDKDTFSRTSNDEKELYKWKYDVPELGWKYNGNDVSAAIALVQLKKLKHDNQCRAILYDQYAYNFRNEERVTLVNQGHLSSNHLVVIRVKNRDEVIKALKDAGIAPGVHYLPNYEFPILSEYYKEGSCPVTERVSQEIISLPNHLEVRGEDVARICEVVINAAT